MKERRPFSIIIQVTALFLISMLITGAVTFTFQHYVSNESVKAQTESLGSQIAQEVTLAVREYPAHQWLFRYWYEHADTLEIEYDADHGYGTVTEQKCRDLRSRHPDMLIQYADTDDIEALSPEDRQLYAEIVYSWLITRINQIKRSYAVDYLFCVLTDEPYDRQFFVFSAADFGAVRGNNYEDVYPLGKTVTVDQNLQTAMRNARERSAHLADAGSYVDYYSYLGTLDGHVLLIGMTYDLSHLKKTITTQTIRATLITVASMLALMAISLILLFYFVLRPLKKVQQNIRLYKRTKDSSKVRAIKSRNEIGQLSDDVVSLAQELDNYVERIESITAEKERMGTELELASRIQNNTLPNTFPPFPDRHEFELYASMDPAREVSGDFYDFFMVDDDHLALLIADVSGKGVPAALFMMVSMILIQAAAKQERSPAKALESVNAQICAHNPQRMFISVWLGILEISTGQLTAANAGHEYPVLQKHGQPYQLMKDEHSFVIGGLPNITIDEYTLRLSPGDRLFVYTDGVPEASNADKELFGLTRMLEALNQEPDAGPERVLANVQKAVDGFVRQAEQFDDLTMMCVEYKGPAPKESEIGS